MRKRKAPDTLSRAKLKKMMVFLFRYSLVADPLRPHDPATAGRFHALLDHAAVRVVVVVGGVMPSVAWTHADRERADLDARAARSRAGIELRRCWRWPRRSPLWLQPR